MKKQTYLFAAMLLITTASYSQVLKNGMIVERPKFGIQAGLVVSDQAVSDEGYYIGSDTKSNFTAGIHLELPMRYGLYLQPEINYSQMGSKGSIDLGDPTFTYGTFNYSYIQVPFLIKYKPLFSGLGVFGGPQYAYLTGAKGVKFDDGGPDVDFKNETYKSEVSLLLGMEYYFPSPNDGPQFGLSFRFQYGLTNISNIPESYQTIHNNGFFLTAGIRF
jgi:hypothetical protein